LVPKHEAEKKMLSEFTTVKTNELTAKQEYQWQTFYALLMAQTNKALTAPGRQLLDKKDFKRLADMVDYVPESDDVDTEDASQMVLNVQWSDIELGAEVGEGAFGKVYRGTCKCIDVAIKELKSHLTEDAKKKFKDEALLLSNLKHDSIIQFIGLCAESADPTKPGSQERFVLLTEFAPNGSLADYVKKRDPIKDADRKKFSHSEKLQVLREVAAGMNYLHGKEILHLDLKPANILLDDCWRARIADFGMSRVVAPEKPSEYLSFVSKTVGGTPLYMAPEVLMGEKPTPAVDVYSFGIMTWEVLNEASPYPDDKKKDMVTLKEHVVTKNQRPAQATQTSNDKPYEFCQKCWDKDPAKRYTFKDLDKDVVLDPWSPIFTYYLADDAPTLKCWAKALERDKRSDKISWKSFQVEFATLASIINENNKPEVRAMAALLGVDLVHDKPEEMWVTTERWEYLHKWFGPFIGQMGTCLSLMLLVVNQDWFFGALNEQGANELLAYQDAGCFLVRYSASQKGVFTISYVAKDTKEKGGSLVVNHFRFSNTQAAGLADEVKRFRNKLNLKKPCPGRPDIYTNVSQ